MKKGTKLEQTLPPLTDEIIESGEDLSSYFENVRPVPAVTAPQKVNVDFPAWVVAALDAEAQRIGVARQALIKMWIAQRLDSAGKGGAIIVSGERSEAKYPQGPSQPAAYRKMAERAPKSRSQRGKRLSKSGSHAPR